MMIIVTESYKAPTFLRVNWKCIGRAKQKDLMTVAAEGPVSWCDLHSDFVTKFRYAFHERNLFGHGRRR